MNYGDVKVLQSVVGEWVIRTFGRGLALNHSERGARCLEEALEFAQATGVPIGVAGRTLERVYRGQPGEPRQELAQLGVTFFAAAAALEVDGVMDVSQEVSRLVSMPKAHFDERTALKTREGICEFQPVAVGAGRIHIEPSGQPTIGWAPAVLKAAATLREHLQTAEAYRLPLDPAPARALLDSLQLDSVEGAPPDR